MPDLAKQTENTSPKRKFLSHEQEIEKFVVRFPKGMRASIHHIANRSCRSMNKEIVARMFHSITNFPTVPGDIFSSESKPSALEENVIDAVLVNDKEQDRAYTELLINDSLKEKIIALSYEKKCALLKLFG